MSTEVSGSNQPNVAHRIESLLGEPEGLLSTGRVRSMDARTHACGIGESVISFLAIQQFSPKDPKRWRAPAGFPRHVIPKLDRVVFPEKVI